MMTDDEQHEWHQLATENDWLDRLARAVDLTARVDGLERQVEALRSIVEALWTRIA